MDKEIYDAIILLAKHFAKLQAFPFADSVEQYAQEFEKAWRNMFGQIASQLGYQYDITGNVADGWFHPALI